MPSSLISNRSGGDPLVSGNPWSGVVHPWKSEVVVRWPFNSSGLLFVGLSGGMNVTSGGFFLSGNAGLTDAIALSPGQVYSIPKSCQTTSGAVNVFVASEAAASGQRVFWEIR